MKTKLILTEGNQRLNGCQRKNGYFSRRKWKWKRKFEHFKGVAPISIQFLLIVQ
jgi:hypothetical protein